jgi:nucleoside-diphosphate-sugar epimerase
VRIIVTGATGFVASHLIPSLAGAGHEVIALGHDRQRIRAGSETLVFDLAAPAWPTLPDVDAVVHLAQANVPFPEGANSLFAVNATSTQRLLEHARLTGAQQFVLASSGSVYGTSDGVLTETSPLAARDFYSATKVAAERLVQAYDQHFGTTIMRLFVPYGPGQVNRMLPRLIDRVRSSEPIALNLEGRPRLNPVYVDDVSQVVIRALERDGGAGVLNVAGDDVTDIRGVSEMIGASLGIEPVFEEGDGQARDIVAANTALHTFLDGAGLVSLREGIERITRQAPRVS